MKDCPVGPGFGTCPDRPRAPGHERRFSLALLAAVIVLTIGYSADYRGWYRVDGLYLEAGYPFHASAGLFRLGVGFAPPLGIGVGLSAFDGHAALETGTLTYGLGSATVYWIPHAWWSCEFEPRPMPLVYTHATFNTWAAWVNPGGDLPDEYGSYLRAGVGCSWRVVRIRPPSWLEDVLPACLSCLFVSPSSSFAGMCCEASFINLLLAPNLDVNLEAGCMLSSPAVLLREATPTLYVGIGISDALPGWGRIEY